MDILNVNADWCGQQANDIWLKPTFNTPELNSEFRVVMDIISKRQMALDSILSGIVRPDLTCSRDSAGNVINVTDKYLEVCDMKVNLEQCAKSLRATFMEEFLRKGLSADDLTGTYIEEYITGKVVNAMRIDVYDIAWFGDKNSTNPTLASCDGLWKLLLANAGAYGITKITIPNTLADCTSYDLLVDMYTQASDLLDQTPEGEKYFAFTRELFDNYVDCQETKCCSDRTWDLIEGGKKQYFFRGIPVLKKSRWSQVIKDNALVGKHRAVYTVKENLWLGVDAVGDESRLEFWFDKKDRKNYIDGYFKMGVEYAYNELTVIAISAV